MAKYSVISEFNISKNARFLQIAESLTPELTRSLVFPVSFSASPEGPWEPVSALSARPLRRNDTVVLDFGDHQVGYVILELGSTGSHPDAPAYIRLRFAERLCELREDTGSYDGWLGKGWFQEEYLHIDVLPHTLTLPRRYAFRYLEVKVIDVSAKYALTIQSVSAQAVSSAPGKLPVLSTGDALLDKIDRASLRTLQNCMQSVFEDGPKRDRRMWLGDFRLQARVNYLTFKNYDLAKRCLYLFAGLTFNEGKVPACVFLEPEPEPDDTYLFDYALFFVSALLDYYDAASDMETLRELYPTAVRQLEIGLSYLSKDGILPDRSGEFWCFVDWGDTLNTQAASLAILIYALTQGQTLAERVGDTERAVRFEKQAAALRESALKHFWDENLGLFVSGAERQVSWATQVWMILSGVIRGERGRELLQRVSAFPNAGPMITPYMIHHYIEALLTLGERDQALRELRLCWGGMINEGADTFWEVYYPGHPDESPYGSVSLNSYCHAWSCTPAYFLRKLLG